MKRKNHYIVLILFIILICFILFIFIIERKEGFTSLDAGIGEYEYLAPIPQYNTWSDSTIDEFIPIFKKATNKLSDDNINKDYVIKTFYTYALEDEAKYYIANSKWPYCPYIINYCNNEPTVINKMGLDPFGNPVTIDYLQKFISNRFIYMLLLLTIQEKLNPKPEACLIYLGEKKEPTYNNNNSSIFSTIKNLL